MNKTTNKLRAKFGPETRFRVRPQPAVPFRANQETEFDRLKNRLLTETLLESATAEGHTAIRRAANEAAALAWVTFYPLLTFPVLFEEKLRQALRQAKRQADIYASSPQLVDAK